MFIALVYTCLVVNNIFCYYVCKAFLLLMSKSYPRTKPTTRLFYEEIRKKYWAMRSTTKNGVRIYTDEYIISVLAQRYFRAPKTIENIVFNRVAVID